MSAHESSRHHIQSETGVHASIFADIKARAAWFDYPAGQALEQPYAGNKAERVNTFYTGLLDRIGDITADLAHEYVRTRDFCLILRQVTRHVADEPSMQKRDQYLNYVVNTIANPCEPLDRLRRILIALRELKSDQTRILIAMLAVPERSLLIPTSPLQTLLGRLPDINILRMEGLITQLNELGLISLQNYSRVKPGPASNDLRAFVTPFGRLLAGAIA